MNYDVEIDNHLPDNQVSATIKYLCGEILKRWIVDSFAEGAALVESYIEKNPLIHHKGCVDEYCDNMTMKKHTKFALGHYLSDWPEGWSYQQIIGALKNGNENLEVSVSQTYEYVWPEDLVVLIEYMIDDLSRYFPEAD